MKIYLKIRSVLLISIIITSLIPLNLFAQINNIGSFSSYISNIFNIEDKQQRINIIENRVNGFSDPKRKIAFVRKIISEGLKTEENDLLVFKGGSSRVSVKKAPDTQKGVYLRVDVFNHKSGKEIIEKIIDSKINSIVVDVKEYGNLFYDSNIPLANLKGLEKVLIKNIRQNISDLKNNGIYTIARVAVLKDPKLARIYPLKGTNNLAFDGQWVDGSSKEVISYHKEIIKELSEIGFDEVQLDYIRFPTEKFYQQGIQNKTARTDIITNFVKEMYKQSKQSNIALSIDTFGITAWYVSSDIKRTGQDIKQLIEHVDFISPMIYPSHFSEGFGGFHNYNNPYPIISTANKKLTEAIGAHNITKVRPWLQGFRYKSPTFGVDYIYKQMLACKDYGINGYLIWTPTIGYSSSIQAAAR